MCKNWSNKRLSWNVMETPPGLIDTRKTFTNLANNTFTAKTPVGARKAAKGSGRGRVKKPWAQKWQHFHQWWVPSWWKFWIKHSWTSCFWKSCRLIFFFSVATKDIRSLLLKEWIWPVVLSSGPLKVLRVDRNLWSAYTKTEKQTKGKKTPWILESLNMVTR